MSVTVRTAPPEHWSWLTKRYSIAVTQICRMFEAVDEAGNILGMVAYDNWTPNAVEFHFAVDAPEAVAPLKAFAFDYAFNTAKRSYMTGFAPEKQRAHVLKLSRAFGFKEMGRIKDGWKPGEDMVLIALRREDWEAQSKRSD